MKNNNAKSNKVSGKSLEANGILDQGKLNIIRIILLVLNLWAVFYAPFVRGLFFEEEQFPTEIFIFVVFIIFMVYKYLKNDKRFFETPIDYAAFGFVFVYLCSLIVAVSFRLAVSEWLKYCMYFAVFFMLSELASTYKTRLALMLTFITAAIGVCILSFDAMTGSFIGNGLSDFFMKIKLFDYKLFFDIFINDRIYSTLQYPGAAASYFMASFFITCGLIISSKKTILNIILYPVGIVLFTSFLLTLSRSAYIVFPIIALAFIILVPLRYKLRSIYVFCTCLLPSLFAYKGLDTYIKNISGNEQNIWKTLLTWCLISIVFALILIVWDKIVKSKEVTISDKAVIKILVVLSGFIVVVAIVGAFLVFNSNKPIELDHTEQEGDSNKVVTRSVILTPGKIYKLDYKASSTNSLGKPNAYSISVGYRNFRNVISEQDIPLVSVTEQAGSGIETKSIDIKVPDDSMVVNISFINTFAGTGINIQEATITSLDSNDKVQKLMLSNKYVPETIIARFQDFSVAKSNIERKVFYKDGMNLFGDHLFGAGGGAWTKLYFKYQSYLYWSTQTHNYPLQVAVETGIVGVLILISLVVFMILMLKKQKALIEKLGIEEGVLQIASFSAIMYMLAHSIMDFELSLSAVLFLLWSLIAMYNSRYRELAVEKISNNISDGNVSVWGKIINGVNAIINIKRIKVHPFVVVPAYALLLILPCSMNSALLSSKKAFAAYNDKKLDQAIKIMEGAANSDKYKPEYVMGYNYNPRAGAPDTGLIDLLKLKNKNGIINEKNAETVAKYINRAEEYGSQDSDMLTRIGAYYVSMGEFDKGLEMLKTSTELKPKVPQVWQKRLEGYSAIIRYFVGSNGAANAQKYNEDALKIIEEVKLVNKNSMIPFILTSMAMDDIEKFKMLNDGYSSNKTVDINKQVFYNIPDLDLDFDGIPDQWQNDNNKKFKISSKDGIMTVDNASNQVEMLESRDLYFTPGKTYRVEVEFVNPPQVNGIPYSLKGFEGANLQLKPSGNVFYTELKVPASDQVVASGLSFGVTGKYEIKGIRVFEK